jgi:hypothetical protein
MEASHRGGVGWALRLEDDGEEGHEASVVEELGDEDGGVALRLGTVNPLQRVGRICADDSVRRRQERAAWAKRGEWNVRSALSMCIRCVRVETGHPNALNKALPMDLSL